MGVVARKRRGNGGFTLIELLIVIIILAVLAAIVVLAVRSTRKDAADTACDADRKVLDRAEEAYFAHSQMYGTEDDLVGTHQLTAKSSLYDVELETDKSDYWTVVKSPDCGTVGTKRCRSGVTPSTNVKGHLTCKP